ncbi:DUF4272 domain-containing protein [Rheinheimera mangrovi]|jgi:hypothetical protein|uniref:DUF4272 domain-containing protein n=1 Tax=Rheinheimera mangrovi TaxID=2498451 RepID=UPI000F8E0619|nr:DUF4272 domain-containing protein [Rheinheimera mangrovi]
MKNSNLIRLKTKEKLIKHGIPLHPHLPLISGCLEKNSEDIARRIVGLYVMLGLARDADPDLLWNWLEENEFLSFLSKDEMNILQKEQLSQEDINVCSWKQESIYVLCWFVGLAEDLPHLDVESELDEMFSKLPPEISFDELIESFSYRENDELLLALDFYYCLNAAIRHPEIWDDESKLKNIKFAAVEERRRAMEWLIAKENNWDQIALDT